MTQDKSNFKLKSLPTDSLDLFGTIQVEESPLAAADYYRIAYSSYK